MYIRRILHSTAALVYCLWHSLQMRMLLLFADLRELLGFSINCSASDSSLIDNKAAALSVLTKSVDLVKDAHEEMEQVRGTLSLMVIGRLLCV